MIFIFVFTLCLVYVIQFYWNVRKYPKGPLPLPIIGNFHQIDPKKIHLSLKLFTEQYGKVFTVWFMNKPVVILSHYDSIKEALYTNGEALAFRPKDHMTEVMRSVENGGIGFSNGENWREQRRTGMHILRDFGVGKNIMEHMIHEQVEQSIEFIEKHQDKNAIDFRWPVQIMVANIINQLLFGWSYPHHDCERLIEYTEKMNSLFVDMNASFLPFAVSRYPILRQIPGMEYKAIGHLKERYTQCFEMTKKDVKKCLEGFSKEDEPTCFAQSYYKQIGTSPYLDEDNLYSTCSDFFVAGMETTTNTLRWMVLYFANYPEMQEKLRLEIAKVIGFDRLPSLNDKSKMPYMQSVILEMQRHSNVFPGGVPRENNKEVTIDGHNVPEGTSFMPQVYEVFSSKKLWGNPEDFVAERFLAADGSLNQELANKIIIFGMGKRVCAGEGLAKTEIFLFSASLIQKYHFLPPKGDKVNMNPKFALAFQPEANPLQLKDVDPKQYV